MVQFFCQISYFHFLWPKKFDKIGLVFKYFDISSVLFQVQWAIRIKEANLLDSHPRQQRWRHYEHHVNNNSRMTSNSRITLMSINSWIDNRPWKFGLSLALVRDVLIIKNPRIDWGTPQDSSEQTRHRNRNRNIKTSKALLRRQETRDRLINANPPVAFTH